jgi:L-ribulokinase
VFGSIEEAQRALCPKHRVIEPDRSAARVYEDLFGLYRKLYFGFGQPGSEAVSIGDVLPALRTIAASSRDGELTGMEA